MKLFFSSAVALGLFVMASFSSPNAIYANDGNNGVKQYTLEFIPTQNAISPDTLRTMTIRVNQTTKTSVVHFGLRGGYPNTVYTIWVVYNILTWDPLNPNNGVSIPSDPATNRLYFPKEGNGVSPLARIDDLFTDGMGLDTGAVFITNKNGDGEVQVRLDYDLIWDSPVGNRDIIVQCAPSPNSNGNCTGETDLGIPRTVVRVTTTWLRRYIGEFPVEQRKAKCANYDPSYDRDPKVGGTAIPASIDARYWQCVDPATLKNPNNGWSGLPRVHRFDFNHFRLAPHPDDLTHGFIGGSGVDHFIDMVGRRCDLQPSVGASY